MKFKIKERISRKDSHDMIIMMARYSNHPRHEFRSLFTTDAGIKNISTQVIQHSIK